MGCTHKDTRQCGLSRANTGQSWPCAFSHTACIQRLLSTVSSLVNAAAAAIFKALTTFCALRGSFSNVNIPVPNEDRARKAFPSSLRCKAALHWELSGVKPVHLYSGGSPTFTTSERFCSCGHLLVFFTLKAFSHPLHVSFTPEQMFLVTDWG